MIDPITVARIQDAAQIVDVVSDFVSLKKKGVNWWGLCPFHEDRTPSFSVSPAKNLCKCFSCGEGGSPVHFIMKKEQLSYPEALKYLAKKYHIEVVEKELTPEEKQHQSDRDSMFILNEYARDYFVKTLHEHPEGKSVGLSYFRERGFRDDIVKKFQLGYSLEQRDAFSQEAQKAGYRREYLLKTGLSFGDDNAPLIDRFRGRVLFPIHTLSGKVVGFGGRILKKAEKLAKYVNSPESEIYSKSNELYGIYFAKTAINKLEKAFLVEGYTDVISMHQAGIENVVASSGTALTKGQIRMLHRFSENITMIYDGDAAGIKAALRGIDLLLEEGMNVKIVLLPEGEDPDSFAKKQNAEDFNKYIAANEVDFIRFKTQLLLKEVGSDPIKRAGLISSVVESIALIPNQIARSVYIQECATLLDIRENVLISEVNKILRKNYDKKKENQEKELRAKANIPTGELPPPDFFEPIPEDSHQTALTRQAYQPKNPFERFEYEILRYVVRYGNTPIYKKYDSVKRVEERMEKGKIIKVMHEEDILVEVGQGVTEFVDYDLSRDGAVFGNERLDFTNPLYKQVFEEAKQYMNDETFDAKTYFTHHVDLNISRLAIKLVSDRYELSQYHSKQIGEAVGDEKSRLLEQNQLYSLVPRATTELKNEHILQLIKKVKDQMKSASVDDHFVLLGELKHWQEFKKALAKELGERIVLRY